MSGVNPVLLTPWGVYAYITIVPGNYQLAFYRTDLDEHKDEILEQLKGEFIEEAVGE